MPADPRTDPRTDARVDQARIEGPEVVIGWSDSTTSRFLNLWLRDNCPQLRHATTGHRVAETSAIPDDVHPAALTVTLEGGLSVTWAHDGHVSTFDPVWLRAHDYGRGARVHRPRVRLWDATSIRAELPEASWPELRDDPAERCRFVTAFGGLGVGILHEVPCIPGTVLEVGELLGEVRTTSWGRVFDVVSIPDANSVAYTNLPLVTHTDEGYRDPAPTVQLQHFLRNEAEGGDSTLVDGFAVAEELRATRPDQFELLTQVMLHFHFRDDTAELEHHGPVIELHPDGALRAVRFSNHSATPFLIDPDLMAPYYAAYRAFGRLRESPRFRLDIRLGAGDLYLVDNRRVLHGRTGFSGQGHRHLQSCYIERDELFSRVTVLQRGLSAC
jgi:gamma-butyrobetaine dioxygenase